MPPGEKRSNSNLAFLAIPVLIGCGGAVSDKTGVGDRGDAAAAGARGSRGSGAASGRAGAVDGSGASGVSAGGAHGSGGSASAGGAGLVACNDGTGKMDCCPPSVVNGMPCDGSLSGCSTGCSSKGWMDGLSCFNGRWTAGLGLFPCGGVKACNDGTGSADCCLDSATEGGGCDGTAARCSPGGCRGGLKNYLDCTLGVWSAEVAPSPCGADAGQR